MSDSAKTKAELAKEIDDLKERLSEAEGRAAHCEEELRRLNRPAVPVAFLDEPSMLLSRDAFELMSRHQLLIAEAKRRDMVLLILQLEGLNKLYQEQGNDSGNEAALEIADVVRETFRKTDVIARYDQERIAVLAIEASKTTTHILCDRLKRNIDVYKFEEEKTYSFSVKVGAAAFNPEAPASIEQLLTRAATLAKQ